ncbi:hypothetical protein DL93DRAFT_1427117 [Clavulina sp. PMI_390]|nr:hypothetical protein DL93DRAFT_1427117 [Clavulina sp. PMI_390]
MFLGESGNLGAPSFAYVTLSILFTPLLVALAIQPGASNLSGFMISSNDGPKKPYISWKIQIIQQHWERCSMPPQTEYGSAQVSERWGELLHHKPAFSFYPLGVRVVVSLPVASAPKADGDADLLSNHTFGDLKRGGITVVWCRWTYAKDGKAAQPTLLTKIDASWERVCRSMGELNKP